MAPPRVREAPAHALILLKVGDHGLNDGELELAFQGGDDAKIV